MAEFALENRRKPRLLAGIVEFLLLAKGNLKLFKLLCPITILFPIFCNFSKAIWKQPQISQYLLVFFVMIAF